MLGERIGIQSRTSQEHQIAMERLIESRIMGLAQLTRSDSQALREPDGAERDRAVGPVCATRSMNGWPR